MSRDTATRSEAAVAESAMLVKEEAAEEQPAYHQLQSVAASRDEAVLSVLSLGLEEEDQEEMLIVSDKIRTLQAVSSRKAEIIAQLSALDQRKLQMRQEQEEVERKERQLHEEMRTLTSQELRSLAPEHANAAQEASRAPKRRANTIPAPEATPKRAKMQGGKATITFEQLRDYVNDMKQQGGPRSGPFHCPMCAHKTTRVHHLVRHLYAHLATKEHHVYKCPFGPCDYRALRMKDVREHAATRAHNAAWTEDMNDRCVVQNNLDCFTALCR